MLLAEQNASAFSAAATLRTQSSVASGYETDGTSKWLCGPGPECYRRRLDAVGD